MWSACVRSRFFICISGVRVVAPAKLHVLTCFIPSCDLRYDFPIKRCSIRLDLHVVLCVVNDIRLSSYILASSKICISDDVRVIKKKHDGYLCGAGTQLSLSGYPS